MLTCISLNMVSLSAWGQMDTLKEIRVQARNVQFIYNSMTKFQHGYELTEFSKIFLRFNVKGSAGWELQVKSGNTEIASDNGDPGIPLDSLQITVKNLTYTNAPAVPTINSGFLLSTAGDVLVSGTGGSGHLDVVTVEFDLSYNLSSMMNRPEGLYYTELWFLLVETN